MSAQPQSLPVESPALRVTVRGRVERSRGHNGTRYTVITCPAADTYQKPTTLQVRHKQQLGQQGDEITVRCMVSGYVRRFSYIDRETGERRQGEQCDITLDVIE